MASEKEVASRVGKMNLPLINLMNETTGQIVRIPQFEWHDGGIFMAIYEAFERGAEQEDIKEIAMLWPVFTHSQNG